MERNDFITEAECAAQAAPLGIVSGRREERSADAGYFIEEVRRELIERFGEEAGDSRNSVYAGGLWVRTSLDLELQGSAQCAARRAWCAITATAAGPGRCRRSISATVI